MPKVPAGSGQVIPLGVPPPQEVYFAMAAAQMDQHGRLFVPEATTVERETGLLRLRQSERGGLGLQMPAHKRMKQGEEASEIDRAVPRKAE